MSSAWARQCRALAHPRHAGDPPAGRRRPSTCGRKGVHPRACAELPQARVRLSSAASARSPRRSRRWNSARSPGRGKALVEERLRGARARRCRRRRAGAARTPGCRRAPGPCRGSPAMRRDPLGAAAARGRCRRAAAAAARVRRRVVDVVEVALHRPRRAEPVQRLHDKIGVAQPAEAVVPVAPLSGASGMRRGQRRDDGAGLLVGAELQRDRRADHRLLPFERHREAAHPVQPVIRSRRETAADALSGASSSVRPGPSTNSSGPSTTIRRHPVREIWEASVVSDNAVCDGEKRILCCPARSSGSPSPYLRWGCKRMRITGRPASGSTRRIKVMGRKMRSSRRKRAQRSNPNASPWCRADCLQNCVLRMHAARGVTGPSRSNANPPVLKRRPGRTAAREGRIPVGPRQATQTRRPLRRLVR